MLRHVQTGVNRYVGTVVAPRCRHGAGEHGLTMPFNIVREQACTG
jgi:hypothetical protein